MKTLHYADKVANVGLLDQEIRVVAGDYLLGVSQGPRGLSLHFSEEFPDELLDQVERIIETHDPLAASREQQRLQEREKKREDLLAFDFDRYRSEQPEWVIDTFKALQDILRG